MSNETMNARTRSRRGRFVDARLLFVVLGAVLLGFLLWKIGVGNVFEHVSRVGWWALPVLLISLLWKAGNTVAWGLTFPADDRPRFRRLFPVFVGVDAANLLPTANLGSEVTKAYFLRPYTPLASAASAVVANKTIELLTGGLFAAVGVVIALISLPGDGQLHTGFGLGLLVFAALITFAFLVQRARPLSRLVRLLQRFRIAPRFLARRLPGVEKVEENLITFYSRSHAQFFGCAALRLASFMLGLMESFCLVRLMGVDISFTTIYILGAFGFLLRIAFFFMPANLGTFRGWEHLSLLSARYRSGRRTLHGGPGSGAKAVLDRVRAAPSLHPEPGGRRRRRPPRRLRSAPAGVRRITERTGRRSRRSVRSEGVNGVRDGGRSGRGRRGRSA